MKKIFSLILCLVLAVTMLAGCGTKKDSSNNGDAENVTTGDVDTDNKKTESTDEQTAIEPVEIIIWHDNDEAIMNVIGEVANAKLASENISLVFEKRSGLSDQLKLYGNDAENGPDMYLSAHNSIGTYVAMGIVEPITDIISSDDMSNFLPMTIEACTYKDVQYALPVYFETLLFMYNKALWKGEIPATTEELYEYMVENTDVNAGTYAVVNQHSTAYNVAPFINGFGGYIINENAEPGLNTPEMKEAIKYNKRFAALQADGDYNTVTTLFNEGKAAAIIGGPWLVSGIKEAGIDFGIVSLADIKLPNGNGLAPYAGVQAMGVLKTAAESKKDAIAKALIALADAEVGTALAKSSNCAPANALSYNDSEVAANEMIMAIQKTAQTAQPMPNVPEMNVMWGPAESLLAAVNKSGDDLDGASDKYQSEALTAIADMQ